MLILLVATLFVLVFIIARHAVAPCIATKKMMVTNHVETIMDKRVNVHGIPVKRARLIQEPAHGTAKHDGTFIVYTPQRGYVGKDKLMYETDEGVMTVYVDVEGYEYEREHVQRDEDFFGVAVSVHDDTFVVGAPESDTVEVYGGTNLESGNVNMGKSVDSSAEMTIAGADGVAIVFRAGKSHVLRGDDMFGTNVKVVDDKHVAVSSDDCVHVYAFTGDAFHEHAQLRPKHPALRFGTSMFFDEKGAVIGSDEGIHIFHLDEHIGDMKKSHDHFAATGKTLVVSSGDTRVYTRPSTAVPYDMQTCDIIPETGVVGIAQDGRLVVVGNTALTVYMFDGGMYAPIWRKELDYTVRALDINGEGTRIITSDCNPVGANVDMWSV